MIITCVILILFNCYYFFAFTKLFVYKSIKSDDFYFDMTCVILILFDCRFFLSSDLVNNITTFILGLQDLHGTNSKTQTSLEFIFESTKIPHIFL